MFYRFSIKQNERFKNKAISQTDLELQLSGNCKILTRHEEIQLEVHAVFAV